MPNSKEWISAKEAARIASVHIDTIYNWIRKGYIPASQIAPEGHYRLDREEFEFYIGTRSQADEE